MIHRTGDIWGEVGFSNLLLVTGNSMVTPAGYLTMGAGCAREARDRYPALAWEAGQWIRNNGYHQGVYGLYLSSIEDWDPLNVAHQNPTTVGLFQTKIEWNLAARLDVIAESVALLNAVAGRFKRIALAFPGVGNGWLHPSKVLPVISALPDNVLVYTNRPLDTYEMPRSVWDLPSKPRNPKTGRRLRS